MMGRTTRRSLLGKGAAGAAIVAAAATLPATVQAKHESVSVNDVATAILQPTVLPTDRYAAAFEQQQTLLKLVNDLENELQASGLTLAQQALLRRLSDEECALQAAEEDPHVEALATHFPGLAIAFRAIKSVSHGDLPYLGCDCFK